MHTLRFALTVLPASILIAGCATSAPGVPDTGSGAPVACTKEAKLCPDGSTVGREGPNCAFAPCPDASSDTEMIATDGSLSMTYPRADFALARKQEEIARTSYIPPCEQGFSLCLYYAGDAYEGTTFDGAGLGMTKRADLSESACLQSAPAGYSDVTPSVRRETEYSVSAFPQLGDAAAGHFTHDEFYRLYTQSTCFEFLARIGQSQYGNYDPGTIDEFTPQDEAGLRAKLRAVLHAVSVEDVGGIVFPDPPAAVIGDE